MERNINELIGSAIQANKKEFNSKDIKSLLNTIKDSIIQNKQIFIQANDIDKKNDNGFELDFNNIENIFKLVGNEKKLYGEVIQSQKNIDKKIMYGKQFSNLGVVGIITDGNPYVILELALRNILAYNSVIFCNNGRSYGFNHLLIEIIKSSLKQYKYDEELINLYITDNYEIVLKNYATIDKVICVGNHELQQEVLSKSQRPILLSGYDHFDLYIESIQNKEFIDKIIDTNLDIQIYIKEDLEIDYEDSVRVMDIDEAISQINYNGSGYSAGIFTEDKENASRFMKEVKSKMITVNTSPTIERICDIKQIDLLTEKTIIYPIK